MKRFMEMQGVKAEFGLAWARYESKAIYSYGDRNYVISQLDAFWLKADREGIRVEDACKNFAAFAEASPEYPKEIGDMGELMIKLIRENKLSHYEINRILAQTRESDSSYQLRAEYDTKNGGSDLEP